MNTAVDHTNEAYWNLVADDYDRIFPDTIIGKVEREAVWCELDRHFDHGMRILELNCGTGIDAVHLAKRGVRVMACDLSPKMISHACERARNAGLDALIDFRVLDTEKMDALMVDAPFDGAFSNFSGLNCVQDISRVVESLALLLKPGAQILLCMVGRFSLWESAWHFTHGKPVLALRSFRRKPTSPIPARARGLVHYPSVSDMRRTFAPKFRLRGWKGIGVAVPPSCLDSIGRKMPKVVSGLARVDRFLSRAPVFRSMGDCVLMHFERLSEES